MQRKSSFIKCLYLLEILPLQLSLQNSWNGDVPPRFILFDVTSDSPSNQPQLEKQLSSDFPVENFPLKKRKSLTSSSSSFNDRHRRKKFLGLNFKKHFGFNLELLSFNFDPSLMSSRRRRPRRPRRRRQQQQQEQKHKTIWQRGGEEFELDKYLLEQF